MDHFVQVFPDLSKLEVMQTKDFRGIFIFTTQEAFDVFVSEGWQAGAQADPTNASPVLFTVVFSDPVSGFINTDVGLSSGTATTSPLSRKTVSANRDEKVR